MTRVKSNLQLNRVAVLEEGNSIDKCGEKIAQQAGRQVNGAPTMEEGKFLLAAQKLQGLRSTEYIISSNSNPLKNINIGVVGKLKSNFWNTEFTLYESQPIHTGTVPTVKPNLRRRVGSSKVSSIGHTASVKVAAISYKVPWTCPASIECSLLTIPASAMECTLFTVPCPCSSKSKSAVGDCRVAELQSMSSAFLRKDGPFVNSYSKTPSWNHELKSWTLSFVQHGCVLLPFAETGRLLLQFGKRGKDLHTVDYSYPLSTFQGFAIFLSRVDSKFPNAYFYEYCKSPSQNVPMKWRRT